MRWATRIKNLGTHVSFTFNHEPETALNSSGGGADFIAAWRKVITVFRAQGVSNADCLGVLYYNKTSKYPNCRWFIDSSQASLTAFSGMANDVYYTRDEA